MPLQPGQVLHQRYRIDALLARGGMGAVYRAWDQHLNVPVVVKENLIDSEEGRRQFNREAVLLANLQHPNLPRVNDHFVLPGQGQYLVMSYVDGEDLTEQVQRQGPLPPETALALIDPVLDALDYLHGQNVVHRDVKPANIKVTPQGQVFLVDFGLAKAHHAAHDTMPGARAVTPGFSPPEQYGWGHADARSDVYAAGASLYAMLTGRVPPDAPERAPGKDALAPVRSLNPAVPVGMEAAIHRALALSPDDRWPDVAAFRRALGEKDLCPTPRPARGRWQEAKWVVASALLAVALGLLLVMGLARLIGGGAGNGATSSTAAPVAVAPAAASPSPGASPAPSPTDSPMPSPTPTLPATDTATAAPLPTATPPATDTATATPLPTATLPPTDTPPPPSPTAIPSPSPLPTTARPAGGRIAFVSNRDGNDEIYLMNADGSGLVRLTSHPAADQSPTWSPDGTRLAFISEREGNLCLYLAAADGSEPVRLTDQRAWIIQPAWSPNGQRIAFASTMDGNQEIYTLGVDGNGLARLTYDTATDRHPTWSPDSSRIAFEHVYQAQLDVYVVNADGSGLAPLIANPMYDTEPTWSPDGRRIAFAMLHTDGNQEIYVVGVDGTGMTNLTATVGRDHSPAWSPDGRRLAFVSDRDGNQEIYAMNADGTGQVRLTNHEGNDLEPAWGP